MAYYTGPDVVTNWSALYDTFRNDIKVCIEICTIYMKMDFSLVFPLIHASSLLQKTNRRFAFALERYIILLCLPPSAQPTVHLLQPYDVGLSQPL